MRSNRRKLKILIMTSQLAKLWFKSSNSSSKQLKKVPLLIRLSSKLKRIMRVAAFRIYSNQQPNSFQHYNRMFRCLRKEIAQAK